MGGDSRAYVKLARVLETNEGNICLTKVAPKEFSYFALKELSYYDYPRRLAYGLGITISYPLRFARHFARFQIRSPDRPSGQ